MELTAEGRAIHDEVMPLARESETEIFSVLSEEERAQFSKYLLRLFDQAAK